ncbi:MAG: nucleotidyltransferase family protein [Lachnospiraceae bacterium]|jgi:molybdenum cofactor cytidylyltransferase
MIEIILLAAGNSRRFQGENKLLAMIGEKPLFLHSFETWKQAADRVGNCRIFTVAREREILEEAGRLGFVPVESPDSEKGISYSIKAGIKAVLKQFPDGLEQADRLVFSVSDQPLLQADTLIRFLTAVKNNPYASLSFQGQTYNPVSFPPEAVSELILLQGDQGGKRVLKKHLDQTALVEVSLEEELRDVDFLKDLDGLS